MRLSKPYTELAPALFEAQLELSKRTKQMGIDPRLRDLIDLRVSQLNSCAYCADMHAADLLKRKESPRLLATLHAWRDTDLFTPKEQAALAWAETLTKLTAHPDMDPVFEALKPHFTEEEIVALTFATLTINGWNRLGVGFRLDLPEEA